MGEIKPHVISNCDIQYNLKYLNHQTLIQALSVYEHLINQVNNINILVGIGIVVSVLCKVLVLELV